jgi:hypothetical protein
VQFDQALHEGQAQAQAALGAVGGALGLREQVEHGGQQVGRDADAVVGHAHQHVVGRDAHPDAQESAFRGVLGGVVEQVGDHLHQALGVALDEGRAGFRLQVQAQLVAARFDQRAHLLDRVVDHVAQVDLLAASTTRPRVTRETSSRSSIRPVMCATWRAMMALVRSTRRCPAGPC